MSSGGNNTIVTLTLPEAQSRFATAAERFSTRVARFVHLVLGHEGFPKDDDLINDTAALIRAADDYLHAVNTAAADARETMADYTIMVGALRRAAFVIMADSNPDQAWFWTEEWQAKERAVDAYRAANPGEPAHTEEEFDAALRAARA